MYAWISRGPHRASSSVVLAPGDAHKNGSASGRAIRHAPGGCVSRALVGLVVLASACGLVSGTASAAGPAISGWSGSLQHGGTLSLNGSGFSVRPDFHAHADKLARVFDDFNDATLKTNPYLTWYVAHESGQPAILGTTTPRTPVVGDGFYRRTSVGLGFMGINAGSHAEYYFEAYVRLNAFDICSAPDGTHQFKVVRLYSSDNGADGGVNLYPAIGCSDGWNHAAEHVQPEVPRWASQIGAIADRPTGWHHLAVYYKKSTAPGANDGKAQIFWDRRMVWDWASHYADPANQIGVTGDFDSDGADLAGNWAVGNYFSSASAGTSVDFDDVIMDHTRARVMLCNANTFAASTQCETQEPRSWSDTRIDLRTNLGALSRSSTLYAYVVDRDGSFSPAFALLPSCTAGPNQAAVFADERFQGTCVVKGLGSYADPTEFAPLGDNTATSLRVGANVQLNLCQGPSLTQRCQTFRTDVANLTGSALGDNTTTSIQVQPRTPPCYPSADQAALYEHTYYQGACVVANIGTLGDPATLAPLADNAASSVRVGTNVRLIGCQAGALAGTCQTFVADLENLTGSTLGNDTTSSAKVETRTTTVARFAPEADTFIYAVYPTSNYGTGPGLDIGGMDYERISFLRFNVAGLPTGARITNARLLLYTRNGSTVTGGTIRKFAPANPTWAETQPTWNAPLAGADSSGDLATLGPVSVGVTYAFGNLASVTPATGRVTFAIRSPADDGAGYGSKDNADPAQRPVLEVTYSS